MTIRIEKLRKAFLESRKEQAVLKGIDYSFVPGRLYVIKGRSGCGKSTLLNLIGLLDKPTSGSVFIDGNDTGAMTEKEREDFRRRNISFLSQDENVIPEWSVLDNLRLVCQNNERIEKSLSGLGILDKKAQKVESLSMGERMRVALARILLEDKSILLLDEPTGNLDERNAKIVHGILEELAKRKTVIVVAHDFKEEDLPPDIILLHLHQGKFLEPAPASESKEESTASPFLLLPKRAFFALPLLTIRHCLFRTLLGFLLLALFSFFALVFTSLLSFDADAILAQDMILLPNDANAMNFLDKQWYLVFLLLVACLLFFAATLFLLSFAYAKEEGKRRLLLQTIGFSRNTFAFLSSLPLFVVAVLESGISLILYFCLKGSLENSIATIFSSSLYAYLPSTPWLLVPILFALLLPFLFAYGKIRFSRKPLAMQIKAIKE